MKFSAAPVVLVAIALAAAPLAVEARGASVPRIGVLSPWGASVDPESTRQPFERGLREAGWNPGTTIIIEQRYAEGKPDRLPRLAAELVDMKVNVIVAHGTAAIRAAQRATSTIPIVMSVAVDPIAEGIVRDLARPGGNVTGLTFFAQGRMESKQLELLKEAVPNLARVGILGNRSGDATVRAEISTIARGLGLTPELVEIARPEDLTEAFVTLGRLGVGAVLVRPDPFVLDPHSPDIAALALRHRVPSMYTWPRVVAASGGLMAYSADIGDLHRRSASYVDRILKGSRPGDLPIEQPTKFDLVINLRTARELGLTIPPSLLLRAHRVIE